MASQLISKTFCFVLLFNLCLSNPFEKIKEVTDLVGAQPEALHAMRNPERLREIVTLVRSDKLVVPVADASEDKLDVINQSVFVSKKKEELNDWPHVVKTVMRGNGVYIQRTEKKQEAWTKFKDAFDNKIHLANFFAASLAWYNRDPPPHSMLDETMLGNSDLVQITSGDMTLGLKLPEGVNHDIMWLRVPLITDKLFSPEVEAGEMSPEEVKDMLDFMHAHDLMGSNVAKDLIPENEIGKELRPASRAKHGYQGNIRMVDALPFIKKRGAQITEVLKSKYSYTEFAWYSVNRAARDFHMEHLSILYKTPT